MVGGGAPTSVGVGRDRDSGPIPGRFVLLDESLLVAVLARFVSRSVPPCGGLCPDTAGGQYSSGFALLRVRVRGSAARDTRGDIDCPCSL